MSMITSNPCRAALQARLIHGTVVAINACSTEVQQPART